MATPTRVRQSKVMHGVSLLRGGEYSNPWKMLCVSVILQGIIDFKRFADLRAWCWLFVEGPNWLNLANVDFDQAAWQEWILKDCPGSDWKYFHKSRKKPQEEND